MEASLFSDSQKDSRQVKRWLTEVIRPGLPLNKVAVLKLMHLIEPALRASLAGQLFAELGTDLDLAD